MVCVCYIFLERDDVLAEFQKRHEINKARATEEEDKNRTRMLHMFMEVFKKDRLDQNTMDKYVDTA